jgi:hypothetical protein
VPISKFAAGRCNPTESVGYEAFAPTGFAVQCRQEVTMRDKVESEEGIVESAVEFLDGGVAVAVLLNGS